LDACEVLARLRVQVIRQHGRGVDDLPQRRILAVENTQRIALEAPQAVLVEVGLVAREVLEEHLPVTGARFRRAEGVELERHTLQAEHAPEARRKRDELRVDLGLRESERLDAQLVELAIAAFLRLFAPE